MVSFLLEAFPVSLRDPYAMLKSSLTHTRTLFETQGHRAIWDTWLPVLIPGALWLFIEGVLWIRRH